MNTSHVQMIKPGLGSANGDAPSARRRTGTTMFTLGTEQLGGQRHDDTNDRRAFHQERDEQSGTTNVSSGFRLTGNGFSGAAANQAEADTGADEKVYRVKLISDDRTDLQIVRVFPGTRVLVPCR